MLQSILNFLFKKNKLLLEKQVSPASTNKAQIHGFISLQFSCFSILSI